MEGVLGIIFIILLFFVVFVALSRWMFRINDIVKQLEGINDKLVALSKSLPK